MYNGQKISCIVPCFNEAPRIGKVLDEVCKSEFFDEIIVVNDASKDESEQVINTYKKVNLITLPKNLGKAGAMFEGVKKSTSEILFFLDADLKGLKSSNIDSVIKKFIDGNFDMLVITFKVPYIFKLLGGNKLISGQRLIRKEKILPFIERKDLGYGVEVFLNRKARLEKWRVTTNFWENFHHYYKYDKGGLKLELTEGLKMIFQILWHSRLVDYFKSF